MIKIEEIISVLKRNKIDFISGVPDSLFKDLCFKFEKNYKNNHVVGANEGSSIGLAIGYHLATGKIPLVYLQNSGLGNTINPLVSLASHKVYQIPMILLIGWRGEIKNHKQLKDEPQHKEQGLITTKMLKTLNIHFKILNPKSNFKKVFSEIKLRTQKSSKPVALLVRKNIFLKSKKIKEKNSNNNFSREEALKIVIDKLPKKYPLISTTGMLSRELNEINLKINSEKKTFMCVGGMGHAVSIATGVALKKKHLKVVCLDGDGAITMHMGSLGTSAKVKNMFHIVFNNSSHDSVGGQKTATDGIKYYKIAKSLGYKHCFRVKDKKKLIQLITSSLKLKNSIFLEILCSKGNRPNLSRPKKKMITYKKLFINFLK
ncbi:phosphonopyruvate decarboxylase [Candidatus Pelagibacter sp.]|nr:phosphonopyruvate decarboxylase [Candidatus Pelagibacter sp.]